ncbi:MAG: hypothetical protein H6732_15780 [Alphaproteobacteria bacterium]|nr:hypothetical protein [Alphaproteobacteria bacterium]
METDDPRASLGARSVSERCAAARDLARHGGWDDLPELVARGWTDPSMPVRLYAAAAAADILGRRRGAVGQDTLSSEEEAQTLRWAFGGDPGENPSMLMLAAPVQSEDCFRRLARVVRDPRSDVRLGVVTAVRRMALSATAERERIGAAIQGWFADEKVPDDTRGELARLVGEAGFHGLRDQVLAVRRRGEAVAELADEALDRLDRRKDPATWRGVWRSDGLDVFELALGPRDDRLAVSDGGSWFEGGGPRVLAVGPEGATLDGAPAALVWATPLGTHAPLLALQAAGRTWWGVPAEEAPDVLEARWQQLAGFDVAGRRALRAWADGLEGAAGQRAQIIATWLAGDLEAALELVDGPMRRKRPRIDLFWWRGRVLADLGRADEAREDLAAFLDKAKGDAPFVPEAQALLAELG